MIEAAAVADPGERVAVGRGHQLRGLIAQPALPAHGGGHVLNLNQDGALRMTQRRHIDELLHPLVELAIPRLLIERQDGAVQTGREHG